MSTPIEDYALLSDQQTGALVSRYGSIDWLCFPRFDSASVFASLLGNEDHGRWLIAPSHPEASTSEWAYIPGTFVAQTRWSTPTGEVLVTDFMPVGDARPSLVRRIEGLSGSVEMSQDLRLRFGYGDVVPWVSRATLSGAYAADEAAAAAGSAVRNSAWYMANGSGDDANAVILAIAGPDAIILRGDCLPTAEGKTHKGEFTVNAGDVVDLELVWFPSHEAVPDPVDINEALDSTITYWKQWVSRARVEGDYGRYVRRSLLTLRALTHEQTGGIVAALTTSLPEEFGGGRNWDYRYCWLRDAALTLEAMMKHGYEEEAMAWRQWLLRAVAGDPDDLQIMYGIGGERELPERELPFLPGYEDSKPVRIGNGAVTQYQADVVGEVLVVLEKLRGMGVEEDAFSWPLQLALLEFAEKHLNDPDHGIWEMRGEKKHFTHSRVMQWAAFDRGVRAVREHGLPGPADRWEQLRDQLKAEIWEKGFNREINSFTQTYENTEVDASLLVIAQVGFVAHDSPEMLGTVARLERDLVNEDGLILRYRTESGLDGLEPGEHPFLACCFWLVEQYAYSGRVDDAKALMDKLCGYANDMRLMAEEYASDRQRMAGNFPQAFSHLGLVRAADALVDVGATTLEKTAAGLGD
ncbi:glycoside hydrolase family 15 protein [Falsarthrobacter nasiphocae]|uniref:GH15 family glucan-1,4-alpha-glucosidase n=1 Tax=Falsarthrobacter nasiphocae TaxID=189863 RepID=A0AAE3YGV9_9MICC|nr:glycoside hydrolase family 15 protein [Falsarthrobacter nasiphocae]MDR6891935.1 GH15 family glucan-1,4-alpha-glucosidase [Falsarthrobacter nasiphocae]